MSSPKSYSSTLRLAWRNLGRNLRRTLITGIGLAVGTSLCVATYGVMDGMNVDILRALTRLDLGHVQVHHPDFPRRRVLKNAIKDLRPTITASAARLPRLAGVTARVYGFGLASQQTKSAGVQLVGVDPTSEPQVTELHTLVRQGRYLDTEATPWPEGRALSKEEQAVDARLTDREEAAVLEEIEALDGEESAKGDPAPAPDDGATLPAPRGGNSPTATLANALAPPPERPPRVLIGSALARILDAKLGDRIHVMSQTLDGLSAEAYLEVAGIFHTGTDQYDRTRIYLHLADLQRLLHLEERVHEIALRADDPAEAPALAARLKQVVSPGGARMAAAVAPPEPDRPTSGPPPLVRAWDEIRPDIKKILQINQESIGLMVFIIFFVAVIGVINTMMMAVFERTRELGMLKAIGMSGGRILWLIQLETALLVGISALVGTAGGLVIDLYLIFYGIDLSAFSEGISVGGLGISPVMHGAITAEGLVMPTLILGLMCFLGAFYPAARAARMRPAQGMREL